jgi:hypothetical protein
MDHPVGAYEIKGRHGKHLGSAKPLQLAGFS